MLASAGNSDDEGSPQLAVSGAAQIHRSRSDGSQQPPSMVQEASTPRMASAKGLDTMGACPANNGRAASMGGRGLGSLPGRAFGIDESMWTTGGPSLRSTLSKRVTQFETTDLAAVQRPKKAPDATPNRDQCRPPALAGFCSRLGNLLKLSPTRRACPKNRSADPRARAPPV